MLRARAVVARTTQLAAGRALLLSLSFVLLFARPGQAQEPLKFFKNYFVTGDVIARGASLWRKGVKGVASANISISGVDEDNVDIVAAFLYVQTAENVQWSGIDHAKFRGFDLGPGNNSFAMALGWDQNVRPCWSFLSQSTRRMVTYRADVLRFLPVKPNGKIGVNGLHSIRVPDSGHFDANDDDEDDRESPTEVGPRAFGASLVIVYSKPGDPLKGISFYDGMYTKRALATMILNMQGFYEATESTNPKAKMIHLVGDGNRLLSERVFVNDQLIAVNPYVGADGFKWDTSTFNVTNYLPRGASSLKVTISPGLIPDCTTHSAMILITTVQDADDDGLLDIWESSASTIYDPNGQPLPNLHERGASPSHKDLFFELAHMYANPGTTYGGVLKPPHSHEIRCEALQMAGIAFKTAPVQNPDGSRGINAHFDAGNHCQNGEVDPAFIVPLNLAQGGKHISETLACPDATGVLQECDPNHMPGQYPMWPGTVGWKTGFRFLRDEILGFDPQRRHMFRFVLSVHRVGIPVDPCLNPDGTANHLCEETNPNFRIPVTNSGIGDFPGGDFITALGAFDDENGDPVGTSLFQAGTFFHESGHGFYLAHYGKPTNPKGFNCNPLHFSSMNYAYNLLGIPNSLGKPVIDYNGSALPGLKEDFLSDGSVGDGQGQLPARPRWYAPKRFSYLAEKGKSALKHCDGSELTQTERDDLANPDGRGGMVRVDGIGTNIAKLDWAGDGDIVDAAFGQDLNFDGNTVPLNAPSNDWDAIYLNQLASRRNVGGYYIDLAGRNAVGPMSLDVGRGDIGRGDIGRGDIGRGDIGRGDIGRGDIGRGDIGRGDIGRGDIGRGDIGRGLLGDGDTDVGGVNEPVATELNLEIALAQEGRKVEDNAPAAGPPSGLTACLTSDGACNDAGGTPVRLDWLGSPAGAPIAYWIYRFPFVGDFAAPATLPTEPIAIIGVPEGNPKYSDSSAPLGANLAYFVVTQFNDETLSGISNFATVTTPAPPPDLGPSVPLPVAPVKASIAQNVLGIGCSLLPGADAARGRGFRILFDWTDSSSENGIVGYRIFATKDGAALPIVDTMVEGSQYTYTSCNSFVQSEFLKGWHWRVYAVDSLQNTSDWSPWADFVFEPCVLDDQTPCHAPAPPSGSGSIADSSGDAGGGPDLVSANVVIQENFVTLQVRFAASTFNPNTSVAQFLLDTDQNAATGHPGTDSSCIPDAALLGSEYLVEFGSTYHGTQGAVFQYAGTCNSFFSPALTDAGSVVYLANGMDVTFSRSLIGNDDGFLNFKVISFSYLGNNNFTGVVDRMTDTTLPVGVVVSP